MSFNEILDEGATDAMLSSCELDDGSWFTILSDVTDVPIDSGGSVSVVVLAQAPSEIGEVTDNLSCFYADSQGTEQSATWPLQIIVQETSSIPTLSDLGRWLLVLALLGLGAAVHRRRVWS